MITALNGTPKEIKRIDPPSTTLEYSTDDGKSWREHNTPLARFLVEAKWLHDNHVTHVRHSGELVTKSDAETAIGFCKRRALVGTPDDYMAFKIHEAELQSAAAEKAQKAGLLKK